MIPIYKPYMPENIMTEVSEILYSGKLTFGKYGKQFEDKLKNFIGCEYVLTVSSYNIAMLIVLTTLGLKPGDEVIASPISCLASNQPFVTKNLKVVWADINPKTGLLSAADVEAKITRNTKAIFHNHFCGYLGEIDKINDIGKRYKIPIIDDGIEAFGSLYKGKKMGNLGTDITVFSFQTVRLPNTIEGGAICFNDKYFFEKAKLIRDYGINREKFRKVNGEINSDCDINLEGYGGLMGEVNSLIGLKQMDKISELIQIQRVNALSWELKIKKIDLRIKPLTLNKNTIPNYWIFGTFTKNVDLAIDYFEKNGFKASGVHINNNIYSLFNDKKELKGVNEFKARFIALPSGWWVRI
jgi:perosamine synthetase